MVVDFVKGRLLVGWRHRDWSPVWYEPASNPDEDGGAILGLYSLTEGEANRREPMEGEVIYIPNFDPSRCESRVKREREEMQKQTLLDAWRYMSEKNPEKVRLLEISLDRPDFRRWQSWFELAKKQRKTKMQAAETRKRNRENKERGAKQGPAEDDSDLDSTFGEDRAGLTGGGRGERDKPASNLKGFNSSAGLREGWSDGTRKPADGQPNSKRQRKGPFILEDSDGDDSVANFEKLWSSSRFSHMSGGLRDSSTSSQNPIVIEDDDDDDDDGDDQSMDYDPRAPKDQNSDLISPSPEAMDFGTMGPPAKVSRRKSADAETLFPLPASFDPEQIGARKVLSGHLPTPYSQGTSERINGPKSCFGDIENRIHGKPAHSGRALKSQSPN